MIDHVWTVVCSRAVVDKWTNNVSIQNVIEQITIEGKPKPDTIFAIPINVVTLWNKSKPDEPAHGTTRLSLVGPSGHVYDSTEGEIDMTEFDRVRNVFRYANLPAAEEGRHHFRVELQVEGGNWQVVKNVPFTISYKPPEVEEGAPEV